MFQKRRVRRTKVRAAEHFHLRIRKLFHGAEQILWRRDGIVVEKINDLAAGGAKGGVALDGRLFAAREDDFQFVGWIIELAHGGQGANLRFIGACRNNYRYHWQTVVHAEKLKSGRPRSKLNVCSFGSGQSGLD